MKNHTALVYDIKFYQVNDEGNEVANWTSLSFEKGETKIFRIKDGLRFKPLEYLCEGFDLDILREIRESKK
jgi:hypothetical protein